MMSCGVTRSGHVTPQPKIFAVAPRPRLMTETRNFQYYIGPSVPTTCLSRIILYMWHEVRSVRWPPHYNTMGKYWNFKYFRIYASDTLIFQNGIQTRHQGWSRCNFWTVTPRGQLMSAEVTNIFLPIAFDGVEIQTWQGSRCVFLIKTQLGSTWSRSSFQIDLSRSPPVCFGMAWREKHDGVKISFLSFLDKKWKTTSVKSVILTLDDLWTLNYWPEVKLEDKTLLGLLKGYSVFFSVSA